MEYINDITLTSINRYFTHLSLFGYMEDNKVWLVLLLVFLNRMLHSHCITLDLRRLIVSKIECLEANSCLVPLDSYMPSKYINRGCL